MIHKILYLIAIFILAACTLSNESDIQISSAEKVVDLTDSSSDICDDFQLQESEIVSFFQLAEEVSNIEEHQKSLILPCKYEGKLAMNKETYSYEIFAGGTCYIYDKNGWVFKNLICSNNCCSKFSTLC
jgi:hypothetical protein